MSLESGPIVRDAGRLRTVSLSAAERARIAELTRSAAGDPYTDFEAFYGSVAAVRDRLPDHVVSHLRRLREEPRGGALLLRGVPLGERLPRTPTPTRPFGAAAVHDLGTEVPLVALATVVGEPYSYREWDGGVLVHNKYPIPSHRGVQFGSNAVEFLVHTETPFRNFSPDYLALLCLRGDPMGGAFTRVCDVAALIESLPPDDVETLRSPSFAFATDNPVLTVDGRGLTEPLPIVTERDGCTVYEYVHDLVAVGARARAVLARLKARVEAAVVNLHLEAGDLLLIDNAHMVHGRSAYAPRYDGTDRWLQRLLLTTRLFRAGARPASRLISDQRLPHYPTDYQNVLKSLDPAAAADG